MCQYCEEGYYQEIDNTNADVVDRVKECKPCPAGHYAPRIREWSHFSEWPPFLTAVCGVANSFGNPRHCHISKGWHVNLRQVIDANGNNDGIPYGLKFSIKGAGVITNQHGGHLRLSYQIKDYAEFEEFRVLINGEAKLIQTKDTIPGQEDYFHIDPEVDRIGNISANFAGNNTFEYF